MVFIFKQITPTHSFFFVFHLLQWIYFTPKWFIVDFWVSYCSRVYKKHEIDITPAVSPLQNATHCILDLMNITFRLFFLLQNKQKSGFEEKYNTERKMAQVFPRDRAKGFSYASQWILFLFSFIRWAICVSGFVVAAKKRGQNIAKKSVEENSHVVWIFRQATLRPETFAFYKVNSI